MMMALTQGPGWHWEGLFMGVHWLWWLFLVLTGLTLVWALWRAFADDRREKRSAYHSMGAEEALRARYAIGEIEEEEYMHRMEVLRRS